MNQIHLWIAESARQWRTSQRAASYVFYAPILGGLLLVGARFNKDLYRSILREDGPVEWAQFALFAIGAAAAAGVAARLWQVSQKLHAFLFALAAVVLVFIAGEEISWGQRLFGFSTPEDLSAINKQDEVNLHNIGETLSIINFAMMLISAWGAIAWLGYRWLRSGPALGNVQRLVIVPFFLASSFAFGLTYRLIRLTAWRESGFTVTKYGEWSELCFAFGICAFTLLNYRRLGEELSGRAGGQPST